ncbi:hypothetical protein F0562_020856 [Nyssa sinensis]|uniref:PB1 domain-containing protein n=1 Tax=Nyssa sinensis TaxID=561372 RepID=A0A5J5BR78_9ASTE|nr:hypothetical protein F0562_020856 [Nyssa sinensis]
MCSYGGKIHPRPHDNQLTYVGGETKILAVDRNIKFSGIISKLSALYDTDVCFKYQLPGEDLDALISVTNDDDLDHMMNEPRRRVLDSTDVKSDRERFVDALNSGPIQSSSPSSMVPPTNRLETLFGLDKGMPPPVATKLQVQIPESAASEREIPVPAAENRVVESDPIQRQIQDLQGIANWRTRARYVSQKK